MVLADSAAERDLLHDLLKRTHEVQAHFCMWVRDAAHEIRVPLARFWRAGTWVRHAIIARSGATRTSDCCGPPLPGRHERSVCEPCSETAGTTCYALYDVKV